MNKDTLIRYTEQPALLLYSTPAAFPVATALCSSLKLASHTTTFVCKPMQTKTNEKCDPFSLQERILLLQDVAHHLFNIPAD